VDTEPEENLRVLYIAEIVGKAGVFCVKSLLPVLREEKRPHFVVANGDGATGGFGIGRGHAVYLHKLGVDAITSGECIYYKKDMVPHLAHAPYVLRAANYPHGNPGRGWGVIRSGDRSLAVVSLLGVSGFTRTHLENPFHLMPRLAEKLRQEAGAVIVDFHACTTAEKGTLFHHLDGAVSAVIGSHGKVATADERVLPKGTAVITDAGRTGSSASVGGLDPEIEIRKLLTQIHEKSGAAWKGLELQGVYLEIAPDGRAVYIERVKRACTEEQHDRDGGREEDSPGDRDGGVLADA
jgi:2',3'-cyclic-nucleotide 2'-phosphodiesterase